MIRIAFISRINLLGGRTNVYNFAKTCEAVNAQSGFSTTLVTTDQPRDVEEFFRKMAVHKKYEVRALGVTDTLSLHAGRVWFEPWALFRANLSIILFLLKHFRGFEAVYYRDESLAAAAFFAKFILRKKIFFEIHSVYEKPFRQLKNIFATRFSDGVIAISTGLKNYYQTHCKNIVVSLCSAHEDTWFDSSKSKETFREELGLPKDAFLIGYTGVVGINPNNDYYEVDDIVRSLVNLPTNIVLVIVGELNKNADWLRNIAKENEVVNRVIIRPWQERGIIPKYLQAFDVNLIPKRKKDLVGDSPAKMFPALAAGRPIIAGRAECIEEVLTDMKDSLIVHENTPAGWAMAISQVYSDKFIAQKISNGASITKTKYTWEKRGLAIAEFIKK